MYIYIYVGSEMIIFAAAFPVIILRGWNHPLAKAELQLVAINGTNRPLVTGEPAEFEKEPVNVLDFRNITDRFRGT